MLMNTLQIINTIHGAIFLYRASSRASFEFFAPEREKLLRHKAIPIIVVAYVDSETLQVPHEEGRILAKKFGCGFVEYMPKCGKIDSIFLQVVKDVRKFEVGMRT